MSACGEQYDIWEVETENLRHGGRKISIANSAIDVSETIFVETLRLVGSVASRVIPKSYDGGDDYWVSDD